MKLGLSGWHQTYRHDVFRLCRNIREFGVENLEACSENAPAKGGGTRNRNSWAGRDIATVKDAAAECGVTVYATMFNGAFEEELTSDAERYRDEFLCAVEAAAFLGAEKVVHYVGRISVGDSPDLEKFAYCCEKALARARELGIALVLENEAHDASRTPENTLRIMEYVDDPLFQVNLDCTNFYQASCEGYPYAYELLKKHIGHVHVKDGCLYRPGLGYRRSCVGGTMTGGQTGEIYYIEMPKGALNNTALLDRLHADGYQGFCTLEPHCAEDMYQRYYIQEIRFMKDSGYFE